MFSLTSSVFSRHNRDTMNRQTSFRSSLIILLTCFSLCLQAEEKPATDADTGKKIYKTRGPGGEIIFSDQPSKDAKEIVVPAGSTYTAPDLPQFVPSTSTAKTSRAFNYTSFQITAPENDATILVDATAVTVQVNLQPGLQSGHKLQFLYDGQVTEASGLSYTYQDLERGSHTLQARVVDKADNEIQSTATVTIHVKRTIARNAIKPTPIPEQKKYKD